ncbi:Phosphatidylinositol 5-phosphate 4-kinase type-2 gamma [Dissostichus eleginoides]|uniref:Phosphatidylinositol 5-phosphate 4-kinase type-2 gamma n=1 Tax=Dissostichus eleginoides TaxID=100907 RepID=A0AAD9FEV0_DISEL|nr:Phosphatidylinositol 5-phosphate 4-kinase type-2 gamma [Dissostichus eleginoides]
MRNGRVDAPGCLIAQISVNIRAGRSHLVASGFTQKHSEASGGTLTLTLFIYITRLITTSKYIFSVSFLTNLPLQFLVRLKIMDYSLLLGIHDVGRAERDEEEGEEVSNEEDPDAENGLAGAA